MNRTTLYHTDKLARLFQEQKIATMEELKRALGTRVDVTVFRKLKQLPYRTSYSHRGRYYTLDTVAEFDEVGLWFYRSVCFSRRGNLLQTAEGLVEDAEAGYLASELQRLLRVGVKDPLLKLVRDRRLARQRISGAYLYLSADPTRQEQQLWARRLQQQTQSALGTPAIETPDDELKAALVLFLSVLDEKQRRLYAGLESLKWGYGGDRKLAELLGLDVGTIACGRRELLEADIEPQRVRRAGGGRKRVEKKRPRSSNVSRR